MKKNNKILNKIITGFLAFAMVLTGAMSLGTMKKHTASAETIIGQPLNEGNVNSFAYDMVMHMEIFPNLPSCFIVDSQFLFFATPQGLIEVQDEPFFVGFACGLRERLGDNVPGSSLEDYSLFDLLELAQISLFVYHYGTDHYENLITGEILETRNKYLLMEFADLDINFNPYYAAIVYRWDTDYYNMLLRLQVKDFPVYLFVNDDLNLSGTGLVMRVKTEDGSFTDGCLWSEE